MIKRYSISVEPSGISIKESFTGEYVLFDQVKEYIPEEEIELPGITLANCKDCYNEQYNYGLGGSNKCWEFDRAKLIMRKKVSIEQRPPWKQAAEPYPTCYRIPKFIFVAADCER